MSADASLHWLASTLAADAMEGQGVLPLAIRPLAPEYHIVGRVTVVGVTRDDNLELREAMARGPQSGPVLLVAGGAQSTQACMGGLMAREMYLRGFTALVTDAPVRDAAEIRASGLLVWSRGHSPSAPAKRGGGQIGTPIRFGDTAARAGDLMIADEDGVVIWPWERYDELLARAQARMRSDEQRARTLEAQLGGRAE
jgi:regulator of RNase E activity RraA